jgi:hypothetical protein
MANDGDYSVIIVERTRYSCCGILSTRIVVDDQFNATSEQTASLVDLRDSEFGGQLHGPTAVLRDVADQSEENRSV